MRRIEVEGRKKEDESFGYSYESLFDSQPLAKRSTICESADKVQSK